MPQKERWPFTSVGLCKRWIRVHGFYLRLVISFSFRLRPKGMIIDQLVGRTAVCILTGLNYFLSTGCSPTSLYGTTDSTLHEPGIKGWTTCWKHSKFDWQWLVRLVVSTCFKSFIFRTSQNIVNHDLILGDCKKYAKIKPTVMPRSNTPILFSRLVPCWLKKCWLCTLYRNGMREVVI